MNASMIWTEKIENYYFEINFCHRIATLTTSGHLCRSTTAVSHAQTRRCNLAEMTQEHPLQ